MHNTIAHHLLMMPDPTWVTSPVCILGRIFYAVEYPSGQFESPVMPMLPPRFFVYLLKGRAWDTEKFLI